MATFPAISSLRPWDSSISHPTACLNPVPVSLPLAKTERGREGSAHCCQTIDHRKCRCEEQRDEATFRSPNQRRAVHVAITSGSTTQLIALRAYIADCPCSGNVVARGGCEEAISFSAVRLHEASSLTTLSVGSDYPAK
jgi:hypothetical protein